MRIEVAQSNENTGHPVVIDAWVSDQDEGHVPAASPGSAVSLQDMQHEKTKNRLNRSKSTGSSCSVKGEREQNHSCEDVGNNELVRGIEEGPKQPQGRLVNLILKKSFKLIERRKTLLCMLITNKELLSNMLWLQKLRIVNVSIILLWVVSNINALSICFQRPIIPSSFYLPIQTLLGLNFFLHHSMFIRIGIVKELIKSFSFWFTILNAVSFHICFLFLWGLNGDAWCMVIHSFSSMTLLIFYDAHSRCKTVFMKFASIIGVMSYIPVIILLLFRLVPFQRSKFYNQDSDIDIVDLRIQALDNLITYIIYLLRSFYVRNIKKGNGSSIAFLSTYYQINGEVSAPPINIDVSDLGLNSIVPGNDKSMKKDATDVENVMPRYDDDVEAAISGLDRDKYILLGILETSSINYDQYETFFHTHFKKFKILSKIMKSKAYHFFGLFACILSAFICFPLFIGIIKSKDLQFMGSCVTVFGIIFLVLNITTTSNVYMLGKMIRSFDYWYVNFLLVKSLITFGVLCRWDIRVIFWAFFIIMAKAFIMIDVLKIKYRRVIWTVLIGIVVTITVSVLSRLNAGDIFSQDRQMSVPYLFEVSARITFSSSTMSISIFFLRFLWSYYQNPNRILFISKNVEVIEL